MVSQRRQGKPQLLSEREETESRRDQDFSACCGKAGFEGMAPQAHLMTTIVQHSLASLRKNFLWPADCFCCWCVEFLLVFTQTLCRFLVVTAPCIKLSENSKLGSSLGRLHGTMARGVLGQRTRTENESPLPLKPFNIIKAQRGTSLKTRAASHALTVKTKARD